MKSRSTKGAGSNPRSRTPLTGSHGGAIALRPLTIVSRGEIKTLVLDAEQEQFAGAVDAVFDALQSSPYRDLEHPFAIIVRDQPVGFFILREKQALPDWAPRNAVTLHSFRIARPCQGLGYGKAGVALALAWIRRERPGVVQLMLAVNARNLPARSLYLNSGFADTGAIVHGPIGDQHILSFDLRRRGPLVDLILLG